MLQHGGVCAAWVGQRRAEPLELVGTGGYRCGSLKDIGGLPCGQQPSFGAQRIVPRLGYTLAAPVAAMLDVVNVSAGDVRGCGHVSQ